MTTVQYKLPGDADYQRRLYPPASIISPNPPNHSMLGNGRSFQTMADVIEHYTLSSLKCDGIEFEPKSFNVTESRGHYRIAFNPLPECQADANAFAKMHVKLLDEDHAGQAMKGIDLLRQLTNAWNPMAGFPVSNPSQWAMFLPLGMGMVNHRAVVLLHYPPYVAMTGADYLHNNTIDRWQTLLSCNGVKDTDRLRCNTFVDVNPIAAPGSGQSEYPNDYFPILMASAFFDADPDKMGGSYIRPMLDLLLNPIGRKSSKYSLPMLVGGSPLYDPQAPGWFRVRYKNQLPLETRVGHKPGLPQAEVLDVGVLSISEDSPRQTPYMLVNHLIAAGVTGSCTDNSAKIPDIRQYDAQDLVAAAFMKEYVDDPDIDPSEAKAKACLRWFGNETGTGSPDPQDSEDKLRLTAMTIVDTNFNLKKLSPEFTFDEALARCQDGMVGCKGSC